MFRLWKEVPRETPAIKGLGSTYEGLKQAPEEPLEEFPDGLGSTYEGLKHLISHVVQLVLCGLGSTYEGLKPMIRQSPQARPVPFGLYL